MYAIKKISAFTLKVLVKDPKRNYKGFRVIFFYTKVLIKTIKDINTHRGLKCHLVYINSKKDILFFKDKILVDLKQFELREKHLFLVENKILSEVKFVGNYLQEPYYQNEEYVINDTVIDKIFQQYLNPLYILKLTKSKVYLEELFKKVKHLNMSDEDKFVFQSINNIQFDKEIYLTMNHGDFWSGNIVKHKDTYKLIDWDDLAIKSLTFDIFHFYFQKQDADFVKFLDSYKDTKEKVIQIVRCILDKTNIVEFIKNYDQYINAFILERMLKRYD